MFAALGGDDPNLFYVIGLPILAVLLCGAVGFALYSMGKRRP